MVNRGIASGGLYGLAKIQYSVVDNIILCFHGNFKYGSSWFNTAQDSEGVYDSIRATKIPELLEDCSRIHIRNIDFQTCFMAKYNSTSKCIAIETLKATNADVVYAATGELIYCFGFMQVWFGTYDRYFVNNRGHIQKLGGFMGFGVMDRYPCYTDINYEIDDYPK